MNPDFERRLSKPNPGYVRAISNGVVASPLSSPNVTPNKIPRSPATPLSSVRLNKIFVNSSMIFNGHFFKFQPSLRRKLFRSSPASSPNKERYGDRFIPFRNGNNWETNFSNIPVSFYQKIRENVR